MKKREQKVFICESFPCGIGIFLAWKIGAAAGEDIDFLWGNYGIQERGG